MKGDRVSPFWKLRKKRNRRQIYWIVWDGSFKRKDLLPKLLDVIDYLWKEKAAYQAILKEERLKDIKKALLNSTFQFSSMYRSWIPKPNKPGKLRPITQPHREDRIVMEALLHVLDIVFEDIFITYSHGFRKGRGPITFFAHVERWGKVDRLIKADIVGCFDNIDHEILNQTIEQHIGEGNNAFCNLITSFLTTEIFDESGKNYASSEKGIPQGSPLSPVLLISFSCILFLGKDTSHIICCLASIGMSVASVLSSPKVYSIERPSLESEQRNEEVGEPYRYSVMNTMWIRSKAPHSKPQGGGTIPSAPRPSTSINPESP